jgi:hypothetical protein
LEVAACREARVAFIMRTREGPLASVGEHVGIKDLFVTGHEVAVLVRARESFFVKVHDALVGVAVVGVREEFVAVTTRKRLRPVRSSVVLHMHYQFATRWALLRQALSFRGERGHLCAKSAR